MLTDRATVTKSVILISVVGYILVTAFKVGNGWQLGTSCTRVAELPAMCAVGGRMFGIRRVDPLYLTRYTRIAPHRCVEHAARHAVLALRDLVAGSQQLR